MCVCVCVSVCVCVVVWTSQVSKRDDVGDKTE